MKLTRLLSAAAAGLLAWSLSTAAVSQSPEQPDLATTQDPGLQGELNRIVDDNGWRPLFELGSFAVALVVLEEDGGYRLAMLNGHQMLYAASLPKVAILFAAMVASQEGDLEIDEALERDLHRMIRVSCNACATRAMESVGRERLLEILQRPEFAFYDENKWGGLWVGKDYGKRAAHHRDPLKGLSHGATAYQVARLYYRLAMGTLLDPEHTAMMTDIMSRPGISHKFVKALEKEKGMQMLRKSGSWKNFHADSALVKSDAGSYILVGLVEGARGEEQLQALASAVHDLVESL